MPVSLKSVRYQLQKCPSTTRMPSFQPPKISELYNNSILVPPFSTITTTPSNYIAYSDGQGGTYWAAVSGSSSSTNTFSTLAVLNTISSSSTFTNFISAGQGFVSSLYVQSLTVTGSNTFVNYGRTLQYGDMIVYGSTFISGPTIQIDPNVPAIYTNLLTSSLQTSSISFTDGAKVNGINTDMGITTLSTLYYDYTTNEIIAGPSGTGGGSVGSNLTLRTLSALSSLTSISSTTLEGYVLTNGIQQFGSLASYTAPNPISSIYTSADGTIGWQSLTEGGFNSAGYTIRCLRMNDSISTIALGTGQSVLYRSSPTVFVSSTGTNTLFSERGNDAAVTVSDVGDIRYIFVGLDGTPESSIKVADDAFGTNLVNITQGGFLGGANSIAYNSTLQKVVVVGVTYDDVRSTIQYADTTNTDSLTTWTGVEVGGFDGLQGYGVATGAINATEYFVAVGNHNDSTSTIQYSTDALTWTGVPTGGFFEGNSVGNVAYGNNMFVAVGQGANASETIQYSTDAINWTPVTNGGFESTGTGKSAYLGYNIAYGGGQFIAVGVHSYPNSSIQYSTDGINFYAVEQSVLPTIDGSALARGVGYDLELLRWYITTDTPDGTFYTGSLGTTLTSTSVLTEIVSANTALVSTLGLVDGGTNEIRNLYSINDNLYFNGAIVGSASVGSNIEFSNVRVADTLSTTNTFTDYLSAATIYTSSLNFDSSFYVAPVRYEATNVSTLNYNPDTKEITYGEPQQIFDSGTGIGAGGGAIITFNKTFTTEPLVVATLTDDAYGFLKVQTITTTNFVASTVDTDGTTGVDLTFNWMAIGF